MPPASPSARPTARRARPPAARAGAAEGLRERNKREKWARIERAARAEFARHGFEAAAMRAIAARARVATGTLFLYARDKRELLFLVFQDESRRIFAEARAAASAGAPLVDALMGLFVRFLDFYARDPALSAAILREFFFRPYEPERLGALTREYGALVAALVEAAQRRGELRRDVPVAVAANALFAHYAYWVQAWLGSHLVSRAEAEERLRDALRLQIEGLRPTRRRAP
ncbi:MAG: TetR/AcrR family transcriptional regulator [Proteobacteria bacterium]|nr:MAG: TetR/AcrR family transcriptional regulator [Pseudomonadota bacterium]